MWVLSRLTYFYRSYCPLLKFSFPDFSLQFFFRYRLEIWYMNLSRQNKEQVRILSRLTHFYRSYCPLPKFSFLEFSLLFFLPSFEILTSNWYMNLSWHNTIIQIKFGDDMLDLLLQDLKGLGHDWGQSLFIKIIWHNILIEFLQKVIQKFRNHFGNEWTINTELKSFIEDVICKHWHEPFMFINIA